MRVYVAGPLTSGDWFQNVRRAIDAAEEITAVTGFQCFVPHLSVTWDLIHHHDHGWWMAWCLEWVGACQVLVRLPGESRGADIEVRTAHELGIPVFHDIESLVAAARTALPELIADVERLREELDEAHIDNRVLAEVRSAGCECGDDEACRFVRERDAARAEVERLTRESSRASAGQCVEPDMLMGDDGGHQYCELRFEIDKLKYDLNEEWNEKVTQANRANEYATLLGKANFEIKELRDFVKSCIGPCQCNDGMQCRGHQLKFPPSQYCRPCRARYLLEGE